MRLVSLRKAQDNIHKYVAVVEQDNGQQRTIRFGQAMASDFTKHRSETRKNRYLDRHRANEDWNDPLTAGFWSRHLLWGDTTSLSKNLEITKKRFDL